MLITATIIPGRINRNNDSFSNAPVKHQNAEAANNAAQPIQIPNTARFVGLKSGYARFSTQRQSMEAPLTKPIPPNIDAYANLINNSLLPSRVSDRKSITVDFKTSDEIIYTTEITKTAIALIVSFKKLVINPTAQSVTKVHINSTGIFLFRSIYLLRQ